MRAENPALVYRVRKSPFLYLAEVDFLLLAKANPLDKFSYSPVEGHAPFPLLTDEDRVQTADGKPVRISLVSW